LPDNLPRVEVVHDLDDEEKICGCGDQLSCIGQETCEKLDYKPAQLRVIRHIRYKYACKSCEGIESEGPTVKIAPPPVQLIPKSMATEGLIAHIAVSKFADALPLYRQQKMFTRLGVDLSRATMANWLVQAAERCKPLIDLMENQIRSGPLINIDETTLQVLNESGRSNTSKPYMWVYCGGETDQPTKLYRYHPTRSGQVALSFLDGYEGYVQSDAFCGYDHLDGKKGVTLLGCMVHVRRKFVEVVKARKKIRGNSAANTKTLADEALDFIGRLYQIEKLARQDQLSAQQIYKLRQEKSKPILECFRSWLDQKQSITPPKGLLGIAINYALTNWPRLVVYLEGGILQPDNNVAENAIRPFVLGRKNWLFSGHPNGASASATFFSLIETAKANGHEPYAYLKYLFERLPSVRSIEDYKDLLPQNLSPSDIA
jgi:transposase